MIRLKRFLCRIGIHIEDAVYYLPRGTLYSEVFGGFVDRCFLGSFEGRCLLWELCIFHLFRKEKNGIT